MSLSILLQQMGVIFLLVAIGVYMHHKGIADALTSRKLSAIVVDICNPALIMASIVSGDVSASHEDLIVAILLGASFYVLLILLGFLLPRLLRVPAENRRFYHLMSVYTNVGFLGIPVARAILPPNAIIYVVVTNVFYSLLFYTHGLAVLGSKKPPASGSKTGSAAGCLQENGPEPSPAGTSCSTSGSAAECFPESNPEPSPAGTSCCTAGSVPMRSAKEHRHPLLNLLKPGTIMAVLSLIVFWFHLELPPILKNTISYVGNSTVFLSMALLGVSIARSKIGNALKDPHIWGYIVLRMILIPVGIVLVMRAMHFDPVATLTMCLMAAVPVGNLPMIQAEKMGEDTSILSSAIAVTTVFSLFSITILMSVFA